MYWFVLCCLLISCSHSRRIIYHPALLENRSVVFHIDHPAQLSDYNLKFDQLDEERMDSIAHTLIDRYSSQIKVSSGNVRLRKVWKDGARRQCELDQTYSGIRVYTSVIGLSILKNGIIPDIGGTVYPIISAPTTPRLSATEAVNVVLRERYHGATSQMDYPHELVIVPEEVDTSFIFHLAWFLKFPGCNFFVDAVDGSLLGFASTAIE
jgi:Zn-dependent metalloprotease